MKIRTVTFLICSVVIIVCAAVLTGGTSSQSIKDMPILGNARNNEEIIGMYQEIIKLRQRVLDGTRIRIKARIASSVEIIGPTVKVSEARIQLAQFQGNHDAVVEELRNIVKCYTEVKKSLQRQVDAGHRPTVDIDEIKIALLEARIRLAKTIQETI